MQGKHPRRQVAPAIAPPPRAVLDKYCVTCHNQRLKTAGLALDALDLAQVGATRGGVGKGRAQDSHRSDAAGWTSAAGQGGCPRASRRGSRRASIAPPLEHPNPGRPTLHRLNRVEYRNAIRDLLALEIDPASLLPADNAAYGFDNNADALSLSPALTERYLGAAAKISQMALGRVRGSAAPETVFVPTDRNQGSRFSDDLPWGSRGGLAFRYYFPVDGEYQFELRLKESGADGGIIGITAEPQQLDVSLDRARVWTSTVGGPDIAKSDGQERTKKILRGASVPRAASRPALIWCRCTSSRRRRRSSKICSTRTCAAIRIRAGQRRAWHFQRDDHPAFARLRRGRLERADAAAVNDSPSRRRLLVCRPASPTTRRPAPGRSSQRSRGAHIAGR